MSQFPLKTDWHETVRTMRMAGEGTKAISEATGHSVSGVNRSIRAHRDGGAEFPQIQGSGRLAGVSFNNLPNAIHMLRESGTMPNGNNRTCYSQIRADALALLVPADPPASAPTAAPPPAIVARVAKRPMEKWVGDDATVAEMTRGLSAKVTSPRNCYFTIDDKAAAAGAQGNMARRMNNHLRRKRAASINMPKFWRLLAQGMSVAEMAAELGVSTRSVERAKTMRRCDG